MEKTSAWVDVYLDKLFAGEVVKIEDVFGSEEASLEGHTEERTIEEAPQERVIHS